MNSRRNIDPFASQPHYRLQSTRRPYSDAQVIPVDAWHPVGVKRSAYDAGRLLAKIRTAMAKRCGPGGWDCNTRVLLITPSNLDGVDKTRECAAAWETWRTVAQLEDAR